ncbi:MULTISPECIES: hypothetical protein [unclassified Methanoculleus]|uniref:hypothetical protein n=1 Tax=unclassified Methanoculleus TaxID=2619537 RepID=UPI0026000E5B|nr:MULTISPECIES: hypothetical protein [unclassified Methanoculleus]MCK9316907.1 hypothetical protein [Methanoculleus sp.]MDD3215110.1 hypothetical protein [Methanoculleus sp.]MDD4470341.1 hypothetical protein [Methanoculleus sp.]
MKTLDLLVLFSPWLIFAGLVVYTPVPFEFILLLSLAASLLVGYRDSKTGSSSPGRRRSSSRSSPSSYWSLCRFTIVPLLGVVTDICIWLPIFIGAVFSARHPDYAERKAGPGGSA